MPHHAGHGGPGKASEVMVISAVVDVGGAGDNLLKGRGRP